jgi:hypothetical protein
LLGWLRSCESSVWGNLKRRDADVLLAILYNVAIASGAYDVYDSEETGMSLKESRVVPMKRTVAPAEGERTKRVAARESRSLGVSSMWMVSVVLVMGSEGMSGV